MICQHWKKQLLPTTGVGRFSTGFLHFQLLILMDSWPTTRLLHCDGWYE